MSSEFQLKYRPTCLEELVGQKVTIKSLGALFKDKKIPHSLCFSGPSGTGKTTLARIVARELGCKNFNIIELDAATHTGVNDMRDLMEELKYSSMGEIPTKFVILDECFSAGTTIDTPEGVCAIKNILVGSEVYNKNGVGVVEATLKKEVKLERIVKIRMSDGQTIFSTKDHLFGQERDGWCQADQLYGKNLIRNPFYSRPELKFNKKCFGVLVRVESVEVYEPGNNDESFKSVIGDKERDQGFVEFYDLQVSGHPSYYANNVLVHNCHMLSKSSWNSLLKIVEEPPEHCYFAFCTTEIQKVPKTIQTRCHSYSLVEVGEDDLIDLLEFVAKEEDLEFPEKSLEYIASSSEGSPRKALVYLSQILGCGNISDVKDILQTAEGSEDVISLCRLLASGRGISWIKVTAMLKGLKGMDPESIRITMFCYFSQAALNCKSEGSAAPFLGFLESLCHPIANKSTGMGELLLSISESVFNSDS